MIFDQCAMELLIEYCYTSCTVVDEKHVQMLLPAIYIFQIEEIQITCYTYSCRELLHIANLYIQQQFSDINESEECLFLPIKRLIDIISSD
ncbi:unnamed protein product [Rotaria sp. Silwood1]|nr:unnamed protein product [Rotaria sp. Silwood1]CAF3564941.1 unnamed protein product [Rotaria sp. Silwood1]CAF3575334.1 unnamed protein product [Rotaria sp. Silwood1]CAF4749743.1 unnamed protein product [Rotaria sp. Silwood1]CAF4772971.1 unnamed protein product [Rotaria sp. Silwood1]